MFCVATGPEVSIVCGVEGSGVSDLVCLLQSDARRQLGPAPDVCSDADREGREGNIMGRCKL